MSDDCLSEQVRKKEGLGRRDKPVIHKELLRQLFQLAAFLIFIFCLVAIAILIMAASNELISGVTFCGGLGIIFVIGYLDSKWMEKHFVDGEWI
jgi:putative flippase GtrA